MREQPHAAGDAGAELPVHNPIRTFLPGDRTGKPIHKTTSWDGGGTPQRWVRILPARWYYAPKPIAQQI